jgi:hypothetical protein
MKNYIKIILKLSLTSLTILFFSGVFRGCVNGASTSSGKGIGLFFATLICGTILYLIWSLPKKQ